MTTNTDTDVQDMIDQLRSGPTTTSGAREGRVCILMTIVQRLPPAEREAVMTVMDDPDVKNREMLVFINSRSETTGVSVTIHQLRAHRAKLGCLRCVLGG